MNGEDKEAQQMAKYESEVKTIPYPQEVVYGKLSDLRYVEGVMERVPEEHREGIKDLRFDRDSMSMDVQPLGSLTMRIVEREEPKCIKFEAANLPMGINAWIQLLPTTATECRMRLTIRAEIPAFMQAMVGGRIKDVVERMADALFVIPYE